MSVRDLHPSELSGLRAAGEAHRKTRLVAGNRTQDRPLAIGRSPCRRNHCRRRVEPPALHRRVRHPHGVPEGTAVLSLRAHSLPSADPKTGLGDLSHDAIEGVDAFVPPAAPPSPAKSGARRSLWDRPATHKGCHRGGVVGIDRRRPKRTQNRRRDRVDLGIGRRRDWSRVDGLGGLLLCNARSDCRAPPTEAGLQTHATHSPFVLALQLLTTCTLPWNIQSSVYLLRKRIRHSCDVVTYSPFGRVRFVVGFPGPCWN